MFDAHSNLAWTTIAIAPSPALTGTSLTVANGTATVFPAVPFNATIYPPTSSPSLTNAEIVRVTNIAGDVLTVTRAQEGTSAKPITSGYRIANTATKKTFTDIETAITALPTFAIQSLSAGTAVATGPQVVFSNSNGITWGMDGNTLTAQFSTAAGGGAAISAGANSQSAGTVVFSNANSISFGMDGAGAVTASFSQNPQQAISEIYAGSQAAVFAVSFVNANGVTFGMSDNSQITASVAAGGAPGSISAGANSVALGQVVFSNSNNVTFGLNGSTVTASASNPQSTQPVAASASNGSFLFSTLGFSNANGVTFGTSAGSIVTASVNAAGGSINFSAGTQSSNLDTIVFSNSNGVSFGLSNGTITASASGGAAGFTYDYFAPFNGRSIAAAPGAALSLKMFPVAFPNLQFDRAVMPVVWSNANNSTNSASITMILGLYTKNASTLSLLGSASIEVTLNYSGTVRDSINMGVRNFSVPWNMTVGNSNYWVGIITNKTAGAGGNSFSYFNADAINSNFSGVFQQAVNTSMQFQLGLGYFSATSNAMPASVALSDIYGAENEHMRFPAIQFANGTV